MWKKVKYQTAGAVYGDSKQAIGQTTGIEGRFNYTLNNAMDKANIAARRAAWDPKEWKTKYVNEKGEELEEEKVTDGYRHALAGYGTARAIRDKVPGWVPGGVASYIGKTGAKALGIGHELLNPNTQDINDVHFGSWLKNSVKEGLQDIHNNNVGANMITQMDEEQVKKKLLMDAYSGALEPGIVWPEDNQRKDYDPNKPAKHQTGGDVDPEIQYQTGATVGVNANEIPSWLRKRFVGQSGPTIISEQKLIQNQKKYATEPIKNTDGIVENIVEFFDPTGALSHDDAKRAYSSWKDSERSYPNFSESMDMFGVVPALGKFGNIKYLKNAEAIKNSMKYVAPEFRSIPWQKIINSGDAIQDIEKDNIQKFQTAGTAGIDNTRVNVHKFREEDMKEVSPLANWAGARFRRPQGPTANSGELHQSPSLSTRASHGITDAATNILGIPKSIFTGTLPSDEQKMANRSEANGAWGSRGLQAVEAGTYAVGDAMLGAGLGVAANKSTKVLSEAPTLMDAYREAMYRGITPGGYGVGKKLKEFVPNLVKNSMITPEERALGIMAEFKRPGMTANQLRESILREAYNPANAQRTLRNLQTKGEKRLDAFSLGVRGKQNFDTFEKIGKDTYRVKDSNLDPRSMVEIVNDFDSHLSMNQAGLYSGQHPLERLTQRAKEVYFREKGVPSEFIPNEEYVDPWFPERLPKKDVKGNVVGVYDVDTYDMIRGGHSWDITPDVGDKTRTMTSFDEWDLHPLAGRGNTRVAEDKIRTIHPFKGMFKDVEFLKLMGGKPFKIQNKFDIDPKTFEIKKAYQSGGDVPKFQTAGTVGQKPVPNASIPNQLLNTEKSNVNDLYITEREMLDNKKEYSRKIDECKYGGCLEQAQLYYDKYVAPKIGAPNSWQIKEASGIGSGPSHARRSEYGESADSWDIHGLLQEKGAKKIYAAPIGNYSYEWDAVKDMTPEQKNEYWKSFNIPVGSIIGMGDRGSSGGKYGSNTYNEKRNLTPSNHSSMVVGYNEHGVPMTYDYGKLVPITERTFDYFGVTNITAPKETQQYTYDYLSENGLLRDDYKRLKLNTDKTAEYDEDEYIPFIDSLQSQKQKIANVLGIGSNEYDELAKRAAATALSETKGGDDTIFRTGTFHGIPYAAPSYLTDKLGLGDTTGITQVNEEMIFKHEMISKQLKSLGITKENYDPWNSKHIAAATMALLKSNLRPQEKNAAIEGNSKNLSDAEKGYYQWNQPGLMRKGEAWGESEKVKKFKENYEKISYGTGGEVEVKWWEKKL